MINLLFALLGLAAAASAATQPAKPGPANLRGMLHAGVMAIGGETTGMVLEYQDPPGQRQRIEVEITARTAGAQLAKDGAFVDVTGEIVVHQYVERGAVPRLVASEIKPATAGEK